LKGELSENNHGKNKIMLEIFRKRGIIWAEILHRRIFEEGGEQAKD
jgi:hypothetical protein